MRFLLMLTVCFFSVSIWAQPVPSKTPTQQELAQITKMAQDGDAVAQYQLARLYRNGVGVTKNEAEALAWFTKSANQNYAPAQSTLGTIYRFGLLGTTQDTQKAIEWYQKAADQQFPPAQAHLGAMYALGQGVTQDDAQALQWYMKAANQNFTRAQAALARMYYRGNGVEKNAITAYKWAELATRTKNKQRQENAIKLRDKIGADMTPQDIQEAKRQVDIFLAKHPVKTKTAAQTTSKPAI